MRLGIIATGQVVTLVARQLIAIGQDARVLLALGTGHVRVPGDPGIHLAILERRPAIGRDQVRRGDVLEAKPSLGQGLDQQVMAACGLGHCHPLALEVGQGLERRAGRHQDGLGRGRRRLTGKVGQFGTGRLGKHRHRIGHVGRQVDIAQVQRLQQRQATGELVPADANTVSLQALFQRAAGLEQGQQGRGFLVADAQGLLGVGKRRQQATEQQAQGQVTQAFAVQHGVSPGQCWASESVAGTVKPVAKVGATSRRWLIRPWA
ncbi:hypothetical protein D3C76_841820 [compost metagenome]